ncbi:hypothetical protein R3P38DRAFT_3339200 [Favolaschia claudopus]|uniref:Secreted protein n=1 Tax=Favolaschia claudopus TaxID=2862362 RepID=A0AAW0EGA7_9AGAR
MKAVLFCLPVLFWAFHAQTAGSQIVLSMLICEIICLTTGGDHELTFPASWIHHVLQVFKRPIFLSLLRIRIVLHPPYSPNTINGSRLLGYGATRKRVWSGALAISTILVAGYPVAGLGNDRTPPLRREKLGCPKLRIEVYIEEKRGRRLPLLA